MLRAKLMASFIHSSTFVLLWQLQGENHIDIMHLIFFFNQSFSRTSHRLIKMLQL